MTGCVLLPLACPDPICCLSPKRGTFSIYHKGAIWDGGGEGAEGKRFSLGNVDLLLSLI
jgi:hypothetical protein